jgi:hypothetical protein
MSDAHRRYRAIHRALLQCYDPHPTGHRQRHFTTLVALICGLVGGQCAHLSQIADHAPAPAATQESLIMRFRRWLNQDRQTLDHWFLPVAAAMVSRLAQQPLTLVMDGSVVGRGCVALMISVVYHGRALPLAWIVVAGRKGHFPQEQHCALLDHIQPLIPATAQVTVLGDGEFDGTAFQALIAAYGWQYVCRTATNIVITTAEDLRLQVGDLTPQRGEHRMVAPAWMTDARYGPITLLTVWDPAYDAPLYLVTNMDDGEAAMRMYRQRAHIETFFSDQKSRGFQLQRSHLAHPQRLSRFLLVACLAYLWVVYLGVCALRDTDIRQIHRQDRCDLSLFRLGLRFLARYLKDERDLPPGILVPAQLPITLRRRWREKSHESSVR